MAVLIALVWFGTLDYRALVKPDEGRYAEIAREMSATGDWLTPRLNGIKYFEKPPLQYWATAAAFKIFGANEWTARLWTAFTGFAALCLVWFTGRRLFGEAAGDAAGLVLASTLYFFLLGHINSLDMGVSAFLTLALCSFLIAQTAQAFGPSERRWALLAWAAIAGAVLCKGLIGLVIPGATLVLYSIVRWDFRPWQRLAIVPGLLVFLAICAPWFVWVSLVNPEFPQFFFVHEHFLRYTTRLHRRDEPWWYFIPILFIGVMPWILATIGGLVQACKRFTSRDRHFSAEAFLLLWIAFVFLFFSASGSKLPAYLLPAFPALALSTGVHLVSAGNSLWSWLGAPATASGLAMLVGLPIAYRNIGDQDRVGLYADYLPWLLTAAATLVIGGVLSLVLARRGQPWHSSIALGLAGILAASLGLLGHESMAPTNSAARLAAQIRDRVPPQAPFYMVRTYDQTLPFYLARTFTLVEFRDELDFGLRQEPAKAVDSIAEFARRWRSGEQAFALMDHAMFREFQAQGLPMRVLARDLRRVIIANP